VITPTPHAEGCVLPVRAMPGARKEGVQGVYAGALKLAVQAPPERGKANKALIALLRKLLGVKRSQIELLSGQTSHDKRFLVRDLTPEELRRRLLLVTTAS